MILGLGVIFWLLGISVLFGGSYLLSRRDVLHLDIGTVVLQEWSETPRLNGELVHISGRRAGITAFVLEKLNLDPSFRLILRRTEFEVTVSSWRGHVFHRMPMDRVASTHTGFSRPVHWLVLGLAMIGFGLLIGLHIVAAPPDNAFAFLVVGALLIMAFILGKAVFFAVETSGGAVLSIRFKGSALNARIVVPEAARRLARRIGDLTLDSNAERQADASNEGPSGPVPPPIPEPQLAFCVFCGTRGVIGTKCTSCGAAVE